MKHACFLFPTDEVSISAPKPGEPTSTTAVLTVATSLLAVDSMEQSLVIQQLLYVRTVIAVFIVVEYTL